MATTDWKIEKGKQVCAITGRQFAEEEEICSAIYDEDGQFVRRDYALDCWPPTDIEAAFSFWKTRVPKQDAPVRKFLDDDSILDFFRRLEGRRETQKQNFRYVLALFLMRRKRLKFGEMRHTDAGMVMVLQERLTGANHEVLDPSLSEAEIDQVSEEISKILNAKL